MQADDFSHAELERKARRVHERRLREVVESTVESGRRVADRAICRHRDRCWPRALPRRDPGDSLCARRRLPRPGEGQAEPRRGPEAGGADRRRDRRHARRHAHDRADPRPGCPRLRGRGDRHRPQRRSPPGRRSPRSRSRSTPGSRSACRACPRWSRRSPRATSTRSTSPLRGPPACWRRCSRGSWSCRVLGSYHTELGAYAGLRSGSADLEKGADWRSRCFYRQCGRVLSPSPASDESLIAPGHRARPDRPLGPRRRHLALRPRCAMARRRRLLRRASIKVLYVGRQTKEKGVELLADSFIRAHEARSAAAPAARRGRPRGGDAPRAARRPRDLPRLAATATISPRAYASADIFLFCSRTDTFGQVLVEAGASGLPSVAVDEGGPVVDRRSTARRAGSATRTPACSPRRSCSWPTRRRWRAKLGRQAMEAARARTWEAAMTQLADGYDRVIEPASSGAFAGVSG